MAKDHHKEMAAEYQRWRDSGFSIERAYNRPANSPTPSSMVVCGVPVASSDYPTLRATGGRTGVACVRARATRVLATGNTLSSGGAVRADWLQWEKETGFPAGGCVMWRGLIRNRYGFIQHSEQRWLMTHDHAGVEELWPLPEDWSWRWRRGDYELWIWSRNRISGGTAKMREAQFDRQAVESALMSEGYSREGAEKIAEARRIEFEGSPVLNVTGLGESGSGG